MDFVACGFFPLRTPFFCPYFPFLIVQLSCFFLPRLVFFLLFFPRHVSNPRPSILPLDYLSICYTTTPRWFVEVFSVINYFYVSLANEHDWNSKKFTFELYFKETSHVSYFLRENMFHFVHWLVLWLIQRKTFFFVPVERSDKGTLLPIIRADIVPEHARWARNGNLQLSSRRGLFSSHSEPHRCPNAEHWKYIVECKTKFGSYRNLQRTLRRLLTVSIMERILLATLPSVSPAFTWPIKTHIIKCFCFVHHSMLRSRSHTLHFKKECNWTIKCEEFVVHLTLAPC